MLVSIFGSFGALMGIKVLSPWFGWKNAKFGALEGKVMCVPPGCGVRGWHLNFCSSVFWGSPTQMDPHPMEPLLSGIHPQWTPSQMQPIPNGPHPPNGSHPNATHPKCNPYPTDPIPNGHHVKWIPSPLDPIPNGSYPEWIPSQTEPMLSRSHPEWNPSQVDPIPSEPHPQWILSQMDPIPNGPHPQRTPSPKDPVPKRTHPNRSSPRWIPLGGMEGRGWGCPSPWCRGRIPLTSQRLPTTPPPPHARRCPRDVPKSSQREITAVTKHREDKGPQRCSQTKADGGRGAARSP